MRRSGISMFGGLLVLMFGVAMAASPVSGQTDEQTVDMPVNLQPRWVAGRVTRYELWQSRQTRTTMRIDTESQAFDAHMAIEGEMTFRVNNVRSDGSAQCSMTYDWIRITTTAPDGETSVADSRQPHGDNRLAEQFLTAMTGTDFPIEMAADGSAVRAEGERDIARKGGDHPNLPTNHDLLESATDLVSISAAPAEANAGTSWHQDFEWNHEIGKLGERYQYELKGVEIISGIPVATVGAVAQLNLIPDRSQFPNQPGTQVDVGLRESSMEVDMLFDLQRGEIVGRNAVREMTIEANITINGRSLNRRMQERLQGQILRIAEAGD